jgi:hypothetical protein
MARQLGLISFMKYARKLSKIPLCLGLLVCLPGIPKSDPEFVVNGGHTFIYNTANAWEISEWVHLGFLDRLYNLWYGQRAWLGFSQGYFAKSIEKKGYLEIQTKLFDLGAYPIGVSYGYLYYRNGDQGWRGSLWVNALALVFAFGFESDRDYIKVNPYSSLSVKIPLCLVGCSTFKIKM